MQIQGQNSISKFRAAINANDLTPGAGLIANGRSWSVATSPGGVKDVLVARIGTTGPLGTESDYTDYHYFCVIQANFINQSSGAAIQGAAWNLSGGGKTASGDFVITAVNPGEYDSGNHSLAPNQLVCVAPVYLDKGVTATASPVFRWVILGSAGGGSLPVGEFVYQELVVPAQNQVGYRMDRYGPLIPNS